MTSLPVPARVPVLSSRARFILVPGLSDGYQDRICFTRSVSRMGFSGAPLGASSRGAGVTRSAGSLSRVRWPHARLGPTVGTAGGVGPVPRQRSVMFVLLVVLCRSDDP